MKKLVIFDLDGTILYTAKDLTLAMNQMLEEFGFPKITESETKKMIGNGARLYVERALKREVPFELMEKCLSRYGRILAESRNENTRLYDGIYDLIKEVKKTGRKVAVLTNKPQDATDNVIKKYLNDVDFDIVMGQRDNVKCKPNPDAVLHILSSLNIEKKDAIILGDSESDFLVSVNAGIDCVMALWGYRNRAELEKIGATTFIEAPQEFLRYL